MSIRSLVPNPWICNAHRLEVHIAFSHAPYTLFISPFCVLGRHIESKKNAAIGKHRAVLKLSERVEWFSRSTPPVRCYCLGRGRFDDRTVAAVLPLVHDQVGRNRPPIAAIHSVITEVGHNIGIIRAPLGGFSSSMESFNIKFEDGPFHRQ